MPLDRTKISNSPEMDFQAIQAWFDGGWGVFAKSGGSWKSYYLDGENGIVKDEAVARELYDMISKESSCEAARLVRISPDTGFGV